MKDLVKSGKDVVKSDKSTIMDNGLEGLTDGFGGGISDGFGNGQRSAVKI